MNIDTLEERWTSFCKRMEVYSDESKAVYSIINEAYSKQQKAYHNLEHIVDCLNIFDKTRNHFKYLDEIEMAIWTHDIVYDIHAKDNELKSAEKAYGLSKRLGFDNNFCEGVYLFVLSTDSSISPQNIDLEYKEDIELLLDIDFSIFGKPQKEYEIYEENIRKEYVVFGGMSVETFRSGRIEFLKNIISHPKVYQTEIMNRQYNAQARINIKKALEQLIK